MTAITYCQGCLRQEEIAALEAELVKERGYRTRYAMALQDKAGLEGSLDAVRLDLAESERRGAFLEGQVADLLAALRKTQARLRAWQRAEVIVYEITPAGREALEVAGGATKGRDR